MSVRFHSGIPGAGLLVLLAFAGCARYVPQPIDLGARSAEYRARRLSLFVLPTLALRFGRFGNRPADAE